MIMQGVSIWDGIDGGQPFIAADHPRVDAAVASRVVGYLRQGTTVLRVALRHADVLDPGGPPRVGSSTATDGEWVWDDSLVYYIEQHHLSPGEAFLAYLDERDYAPRRPSPDELDALVRVLGGPAAQGEE